jgi:hypothetical protein
MHFRDGANYEGGWGDRMMLRIKAGFGRIFLGHDTNLETKCLWNITAGALGCSISEAFPIGNQSLSIPICTAIAVEIGEYVQVCQQLDLWHSREHRSI